MNKIVVAVLLLCLLFAGCSNAPTTSSLPVFNCTGSGDAAVGMVTEVTDSFHVSKPDWLVEVHCEELKPADLMGLNVTVYPKGKTADLEYIGAVNQSSPGTTKTYFHGAGDFFLVILGNNIKTWTVQVYE